MFRHALVALDGSRLAESVLPAAAWLAGRHGTELTLLHLVEHDPPPSVHGDRHLTRPDEAEDYLAGLVPRLPAGARVSHHVHAAALSHVPHGIVDHARELDCDLILLCSHGRGGLKALLFGRIAQQVLAESQRPILLIRPPAAAEFDAGRLLVPLDGEPVHEAGLKAATRWSKAAGSALRLLRVVPTLETLSGAGATTGRFAPAATRASLELAVQEAAGYLEERRRDLPAGLTADAVIRRGETAAQIAAEADEWPAELVVLATHGTIGARAFWAGRAGHSVVSRCRRPLLLIPVSAPGAV